MRKSRARGGNESSGGLSEALGGCLTYGFFAAFAIAGLGALVMTFVLPVYSLLEARLWSPATCEILSSQIASSSSSDGTTYRAEITYAFEVDGRRFEGQRHNFSSSSGESSARQAVDRYRDGSEVPCWFDPDDPTRSVLDRSPGWFLLWGLFPIPFLAIGFGGIWYMSRQPDQIRKARTLKSTRVERSAASPPPATASGLYGGSSRQSGSVASGSTASAAGDRPGFFASAGSSALGASHETPALLPADPPLRTATPDPEAFTPDANGRLPLDPPTSAGAKVVGMTVFSLLWNLFTVFLIVPAIRENVDEGAFGLLVSAFMSIFVLVGIATAIGVVYFALATANPVPRLVLDRARPTPGDRCRVAWTFRGRVDRIESLTLKLHARERATYQRGTNSVTEHHALYEQDLVTLEGPVDSRGSVEFEIPENAMPTFTARKNEIEWRLVIHGDISRWPDVKEEMVFPVYAPEPDAGERSLS